MKHTTIDSSILPKAWLTWTTTKATFYVNCETNEKSNDRPDVDFSWRNRLQNLLVNSGAKPYWAYAKYHDDIDMLELACATFDTRRTAESHEWKYAGNKYFINKSKQVFDENLVPCDCNYYLYPQHRTSYFKGFLDMLIRLDSHPNATKEFHKFLGRDSYTIGNGKTVKAEWFWHIREWYIRKQKEASSSKGKEQALVDKLTSIPLQDIDIISKQYPVLKKEVMQSWGAYTYTMSNLIHFEKVDENWSVLRIIARSSNGEHATEVERMYISENGKNRVCTPARDGWIPQKRHKDWNRHTYYIANKEEAMSQSKRLKYILPVINEDEGYLKRVLFNTLRFPEIEQLIKMGYDDFAEDIAESDTPKADLKNFFGMYNEKEKNTLRKIGLTKHQLDFIMMNYPNHSRDSSKALRETRELFGDNFAHLDKKTFEEYFATFFEIYCRIYSGYDSYLARYNLDKKKFLKCLIRLRKANGAIVYSMTRDTFNMYSSLNYGTQPEMDWYFDSYSDLTRAHDAIMALQQAQYEERRAIYDKQAAERRKKEEEKRKELDKTRKEYEYEDDDYIIRLPIDSAEIVNEGTKQRICIGGYTSDHALGRTTLFFLRKKSEPDKPFYAIEMKNDNIIQIHGFGNRWLGNNPEAIPTVIRWLRKNGFKCTDHILTCTATGYGSTNNHCAMPVVEED